jgi:hypothetical protein
VRVYIVLGISLVASCITVPTSSENAYLQDQVRKAVFEFQFKREVSGQKGQVPIYCLSLSLAGEPTVDPSQELLDLFVAHKSQIRKVSDCNRLERGVFDRVSGTQGILFFVTSVSIHGTRATARGGYYESDLSSSLNTFHLRQSEDGAWRVESSQLDAIS